MIGTRYDASVDYYATLDVPANSSAEAIKRRFRELARILHPDVNAEPDAAERFKRVASAYEILGDPEIRIAYDQARAELVRQRMEQERRERELPLRWAEMRKRQSRPGRTYHIGPEATETLHESWHACADDGILIDRAQYRRLVSLAAGREILDRFVQFSFAAFIAIGIRGVLGWIEQGEAGWLFYPRAFFDITAALIPYLLGFDALHHMPLAWGFTAGLCAGLKDRGLKVRLATLKAGLAAYEQFTSRVSSAAAGTS